MELNAILALVNAVPGLAFKLFGVKALNRLGDTGLDLGEAWLKAQVSNLQPGKVALLTHYVNEFTAKSAALNELNAIAQPSAEQQDRVNTLKAELAQSEQKMLAYA